MTKCPYCFGQIEPAARKCVHCGEWVSETREGPEARPRPDGSLRSFFESGDLDDTLNTGLKWYVKYRIAAAIVGFIVFLIFFVAIWLPGWNRANSFDNQFRVPETEYSP